MESIYPELALCGRKNECARTDTVFFRISEVSEGMVCLAVPVATAVAVAIAIGNVVEIAVAIAV